MQNQNPVVLPKVKNKQHKPVVVQASATNKTKTTLLLARPPRRSKRLREKASGYLLDGVSSQNEASFCVHTKKKRKYSCSKIAHSKELLIAPPLAPEEDEIKSHYYKAVKVNIEGFGNKMTVYNRGEETASSLQYNKVYVDSRWFNSIKMR